MPTRNMELEARRAAAKAGERIADDLRSLCADAGISARRLASETGLDRGYVARILRGEANPSLETYARLAVPLGADLSTRLYPNTGPTIRDRWQAPILEWLVGVVHPRWRPFPEVRVWQPSKGWIDVVLHDARAGLAIAVEIQSELRRLEQLVRWSEEKAVALPSWSGWPELEAAAGQAPAPAPGPGSRAEPKISRLLVVRRTRATRAVAREFERQLTLAYPAHPDDAMAALTGTKPWPGPALVWVIADGDGVRFLSGR